MKKKKAQKKKAQKKRAQRKPKNKTVVLPSPVDSSLSVVIASELADDALIEKEMMGHRLGEFALTRKRVSHSAPGIGSTRSSASLSVR